MGAAEFPDMNMVGMEATTDSRPIHRVYVDGFWMDKTEVTNAQFAPNGYGLYDVGRERMGVGKRLVSTRLLRSARFGRERRTKPARPRDVLRPE